MKDICQALYEYLSGQKEIASQVGVRIYPIVLPQDAPLPSIVYAPVLANYDSALQGDTGYARQFRLSAMPEHSSWQGNCHEM